MSVTMLLPLLAAALFQGNLIQAAAPAARIASIEVRGARVIDPETAVRSLRFIRKGEPWHSGAMDADVEMNLKSLLKSRGLLKSEVRWHALPVSDGLVRVEIDVDEGRQYRLAQLSFRENVVFTEEELARQIDLRPGDVLDHSKIVAGLRAIQRLHGERGYIELSYIPEESFDESAGTVSLTFRLHEDAPYRVGWVAFVGAFDQEEEDRVRATVPLRPGEIFRPSQVDAGAAAIGGLGPYLAPRERDVNVEPIRAEGLVAVTFRLQRKPEAPADRLGRVELREVTVFPKEELRALLKAKDGDRFTTADIKTWLERIRELYAEKGYLDLSYVPEQSSRPAERKVDLTFTFDEGKQYRVHRLSIAGAVEVDNARVRKVLEAVEPGNVYRPSALAGAVEEINKLGLYEPLRLEDVRLTLRRDSGPEVYLEFQLRRKNR